MNDVDLVDELADRLERRQERLDNQSKTIGYFQDRERDLLREVENLRYDKSSLNRMLDEQARTIAALQKHAVSVFDLAIRPPIMLVTPTRTATKVHVGAKSVQIHYDDASTTTLPLDKAFA